MTTPEAHPAGSMVMVRGVRVHPAIVPALQGWLAHHGDVRLTSGWRSPATNRRVGGAPRSRHLLGRAVDVVGPARTLAHLRRTAPAYGATEVLMEHDHLHVGWPRVS